MARETKQERLVRAMLDQVTEHLHELKAHAENIHVKESDIEMWCLSVLKGCLGFTVTNGYTITSQETKGRMRPDLIISKNDKPIIIMEIKKLGYDLNKADFRSGKLQLMEYLKNYSTARYGILSNGYEWKLFDFSDLSFGGIEIISFDFRTEEDQIDLNKRAIEDYCWELTELHESTFSSKAWEEYSKEATAFSPESLARAILSVDSVKYIAKVIKGEHEYKASTEVLIEKIFNLLANGLDDLSTGWTETKQLEFNKYIKTQKRAGRRKSRKPKTEQSTSSTSVEEKKSDVAEPVVNLSLVEKKETA